MEKEEFAQHFAENAAAKVEELLKEAYIKGYEQGLVDAGTPLNIDGVTYVDMGLPSGTMWSKYSLEYCDYGYKQRKLSYLEAIKLPIPTVEQWQELCQYCRFEKQLIIGLSGGRIGYDYAPAGYRIHSLGEGCKENRNMFWLKSDVDSDNHASAMIYDFETDDEECHIFKGTSKHFIGYKLPVFLVREKG